jgi:hypothetical protein
LPVKLKRSVTEEPCVTAIAVETDFKASVGGLRVTVTGTLRLKM